MKEENLENKVETTNKKRLGSGVTGYAIAGLAMVLFMAGMITYSIVSIRNHNRIHKVRTGNVMGSELPEKFYFDGNYKKVYLEIDGSKEKAEEYMNQLKKEK